MPTLGPSSRICTSFPMLFIHSDFFMISPFPYFAPKSLCVSRIVVGISWPILSLLTGRIFFRCFEMSCFVCTVWPCLSVFLFFLLWLLPSDLSLRVLSFVLTVLLFSAHLNIFSCFPPVFVFLLYYYYYYYYYYNYYYYYYYYQVFIAILTGGHHWILRHSKFSYPILRHSKFSYPISTLL